VESDKDYTQYLHELAQDFIANNEEIHACIFKSDSPACGIDVQVYNNDGQLLENKTAGIFTQALQKSKKDLVIVKHDQILDELERDDFYTKLFCLSEFKQILKDQDKVKLINFHNKNKYLFKLYNSSSFEMLDILVNSNQDNIFNLYEEILKTVFDKKYQKEGFKKVTIEIIDYFKDYINLKEQAFIKEVINDYEDNIVSQGMIEYILRNNLLRFNIERVYDQTLFEKYPKKIQL